MKKLVAAFALSALTSSAFAAHTGAYVGAGLGYSRLDTPNFTVEEGLNYSHSRGGLGERVFAGYNFNPYAGLEIGLANFAQSKYKSYNSTESETLKYNLYALELVGKAYLPIQETSFNLYGLAGLAYVNSKVKNTAEINGIPDAENNINATTRKIRPVVGLGASYDISSNVTTSLEFSRIIGQGNTKTSARAIPNADMLSFNVSYNFQ